ncbi:hypothetical protein R1sor_005329 [Riccia sorocarpa]|uniref:Uncharacterized protein n=1 Tax=Riccia sorocarpa TaxID=122646 RepID=A0ABD3HJU9_9MARC
MVSDRIGPPIRYQLFASVADPRSYFGFASSRDGLTRTMGPVWRSKEPGEGPQGKSALWWITDLVRRAGGGDGRGGGDSAVVLMGQPTVGPSARGQGGLEVEGTVMRDDKGKQPYGQFPG